METEVIDQITEQASCGNGVLLFTYLGLSVGSNKSKIENWDNGKPIIF